MVQRSFLSCFARPSVSHEPEEPSFIIYRQGGQHRVPSRDYHADAPQPLQRDRSRSNSLHVTRPSGKWVLGIAGPFHRRAASEALPAASGAAAKATARCSPKTHCAAPSTPAAAVSKGPAPSAMQAVPPALRGGQELEHWGDAVAELRYTHSSGRSSAPGSVGASTAGITATGSKQASSGKPPPAPAPPAAPAAAAAVAPKIPSFGNSRSLPRHISVAASAQAASLIKQHKLRSMSQKSISAGGTAKQPPESPCRLPLPPLPQALSIAPQKSADHSKAGPSAQDAPVTAGSTSTKITKAESLKRDAASIRKSESISVQSGKGTLPWLEQGAGGSKRQGSDLQQIMQHRDVRQYRTTLDDCHTMPAGPPSNDTSVQASGPAFTLSAAHHHHHAPSHSRKMSVASVASCMSDQPGVQQPIVQQLPVPPTLAQLSRKQHLMEASAVLHVVVLVALVLAVLVPVGMLLSSWFTPSAPVKQHGPFSLQHLSPQQVQFPAALQPCSILTDPGCMQDVQARVQAFVTAARELSQAVMSQQQQRGGRQG